jgi:hypothetical protein
MIQNSSNWGNSNLLWYVRTLLLPLAPCHNLWRLSLVVYEPPSRRVIVQSCYSMYISPAKLAHMILAQEAFPASNILPDICVVYFDWLRCSYGQFGHWRYAFRVSSHVQGRTVEALYCNYV